MSNISEEKIELLKKYINECNNIVFFGGAGVSTESNIPDFRSSDGLFNKKLNRHYTPEQMVSHSFFLYHPEEFYEFYKKSMIYPDAKPNNAHYALAKLEKEGKLKACITQNIDGLHQMAGSKKVFELHGTVHSNTCVKCHTRYNLDEFLNLTGPVPKCSVCGNIVKPDVVLYEESLDENTILGSIEAIKNADMLIIGGTSLVVYPAAGFINYFNGKYLVVINKSQTHMDSKANLTISDSISEVLEKAIL